MSDTSRYQQLLDDVRIASPCPADWDQMRGRGRVRHCGECNKKVYDLSAMTARQAGMLLEKHGHDLCARLYRRADGTVLTDDCPIGLRVVRGARKAIATVFAIVFGGVLIVAGVLGFGRPNRDGGSDRPISPFASSPGAHQPVNGGVCVGNVAPPRPPLLVAVPVTVEVTPSPEAEFDRLVQRVYRLRAELVRTADEWARERERESDAAARTDRLVARCHALVDAASTLAYSLAPMAPDDPLIATKRNECAILENELRALRDERVGYLTDGPDDPVRRDTLRPVPGGGE